MGAVRFKEPGQIIEVNFEELERAPLEVLQHIYKELDLPSFDNVAHGFESYIASQRTYRKNQFELFVQSRECIDSRWAFAFYKLSYGVE
jgi:omega-hydroxy-beta-dihydromenaquinone-9 sulfotransferase